MDAYVVDWLNMLLRWLHLIAGAAWIGASFYFVHLDNALRPPETADDVKRGVHGDYWAVHGGGFYRSQKYLAGPRGEPLTQHLHWSKWEAYTTWLSGMGLLAVIYWLGADTMLIDNNVLPMTAGGAIGTSIAFIAGGWLIYDRLCRSIVGRETILGAVVFALIAFVDWSLFHIFGARAAFMHVGAVMGTIMVANVFVHIIPGQKKMVAAIRAGQAVDPGPGAIGKQRSVHNTYFTLPVLFIMIGSHFSMVFSHSHAWVALLGIMLAGVLVRQFFVLRIKGVVAIPLLAIAFALLLSVGILLAPKSVVAAKTIGFAQVKAVLDQRCVKCHAATPTFSGFAQAPKDVMLETPAQIAGHAAKVAETTANRYMPIGNLTGMTDDERSIIAAWFVQGAKVE